MLVKLSILKLAKNKRTAETLLILFMRCANYFSASCIKVHREIHYNQFFHCNENSFLNSPHLLFEAKLTSLNFVNCKRNS